MQNSQRALLVSALALGFGLAPLGTAWSASSGAGGTSSASAPTTTTAAPTTNASSDFLTAKAKVTAGDYKGALPILEKIVAKDRNNADAFNLLGFSNRKLVTRTTHSATT